MSPVFVAGNDVSIIAAPMTPGPCTIVRPPCAIVAAGVTEPRDDAIVAAGAGDAIVAAGAGDAIVAAPRGRAPRFRRACRAPVGGRRAPVPGRVTWGRPVRDHTGKVTTRGLMTSPSGPSLTAVKTASCKRTRSQGHLVLSKSTKVVYRYSRSPTGGYAGLTFLF